MNRIIQSIMNMESVMVEFCQRIVTAGWHQKLTLLFYPGLGPSEVWTGLSTPKQNLSSDVSVSVVRRIFRQMSDLEKSVGFRRISSHLV